MLLSWRPSKSLLAPHCCPFFPQRLKGICQAVKRDVKPTPSLKLARESCDRVLNFRRCNKGFNQSVSKSWPVYIGLAALYPSNFWWHKYNHDQKTSGLLGVEYRSAHSDSFVSEMRLLRGLPWAKWGINKNLLTVTNSGLSAVLWHHDCADHLHDVSAEISSCAR